MISFVMSSFVQNLKARERIRLKSSSSARVRFLASDEILPSICCAFFLSEHVNGVNKSSKNSPNLKVIYIHEYHYDSMRNRYLEDFSSIVEMWEVKKAAEKKLANKEQS
mmetsp:Transcript_6231/g.9719  ORF Transcript_6231/g.9719 Transcript_6231/m.9719 type:complete len:109 (-) Transcript_6231:229-555(-)